MSEKEVAYLIEYSGNREDLKLSNIMRNVAPDIPVKSIPIRDMYTPATTEELGDLEAIKVLVTPPFPFARMLKAKVQLSNLQWLHIISTGVEDVVDYFKESRTEPSYLLTRSLVSTEIVSEYVIGQVLAHQRQFYKFYDQQKKSEWNRRTGSVETLKNFTVVILGAGTIGRRIAELCKVFGMTVHGVTRTPVAPDQKSPHFDRYRTVEEIDTALSEGDYVISVLPSTAQTRGLLDNDRLRVCKVKKPVFINVGRGDLMTEESVIKAVRSGWISDAVLDVFPCEPLPPDSLLWKEPGVIVTPHVASNLNQEVCNMLVDDVVENYRRFKSGLPLKNEVDINRGY